MTTGDARSSDATARTDASGEGEPLPPSSAPVALAVGVDLLEIERFVGTWRRFGDHFLQKVFTANEQTHARGRIERLAGRFAAKEACAKALGTGLGAIRWHDIEIVRLPSGKPAVRLHGAAVERARHLGLTAFDVSISDTNGHALAVVVGVGVTAPANEKKVGRKPE